MVFSTRFEYIEAMQARVRRAMMKGRGGEMRKDAMTYTLTEIGKQRAAGQS